METIHRAEVRRSQPTREAFGGHAFVLYLTFLCASQFGLPQRRLGRNAFRSLTRSRHRWLRRIRGGAPSKRTIDLVSMINATNRTFYYQDAEEHIQGPFTKNELKDWRGDLPMDLPVMLEPKKVRRNEEFMLLANVLEDEPLYFHWRDSVRDHSRDPEVAGFCLAPSAEDYEAALFGKTGEKTIKSKTITDISQTEQGIGYYWKDVYGGWQGPFTPQVLCNWKDQIPLDTALWHWDGSSFSENPIEYAEVIDEGDMLRLWRIWNPEMVAEKIGYGKGPTITDFKEEVSAKHGKEREARSKTLTQRPNVTTNMSQTERKPRSFSGSSLWSKELEDEVVAKYANMFDEGDPTRIAIESGVPFMHKHRKHVIEAEGFYEKPEDEDAEVPEDVQVELERRQEERDQIEKMRKRSKFGDGMYIDDAQAQQDRALYGSLGLWLDPSTVSAQMDFAHKFRRQKKDRATIQYLKERKRKVRAKMMEDWYHDDDDIGDLMYAREVTDPRVKELLKSARKSSDAPMSRRRRMVQLARERGEKERPDAFEEY